MTWLPESDIIGPMNADRRTIRTVIADDDEGVRDALVGLLGDHPGLELVGVAQDGREAAEVCRSAQPDLVVLDVMMPFGDTEASAGVLAASPGTLVVFHTAHADRRTRERLIGAGATSVLGKGQIPDLCSQLVSLVEGHSTEDSLTEDSLTRDSLTQDSH